LASGLAIAFTLIVGALGLGLILALIAMLIAHGSPPLAVVDNTRHETVPVAAQRSRAYAMPSPMKHCHFQTRRDAVFRNDQRSFPPIAGLVPR
jgi:hypothetical protein